MLRIPLIVLGSLFSILPGPMPLAGPVEDPAAKEELIRQREEREKAAEEFQKKLRAELEELGDHPWAGEYFQGDGLGVNQTLILAPSGYYFQWRGCLGVYAREFGELKRNEKRDFLLPNSIFRFVIGDEKKSVAVTPVQWGERMYLVSRDEMPRFVSSVNSREEPRRGMHGMYFLRRGDAEKWVEGFPQLPEEYAKLLRKAELVVRVIDFDEPTSRTITDNLLRWECNVTVDAGFASRVFEGMELYAVDSHVRFGTMKVEDAGKMESKAKLSVIGNSKPVLRKGMEFSTVPSWRAIQAEVGDEVI